MTPVRFHLPGLRYNYPLNMFWVSMMEVHPEYFREGVEIGSFFGSFPISLWNGGRLVRHDQCDASYVKNVIKSINDKGIPVRFTFTNPLITEADLEDPFCNFCMRVADNGKNEVIVMSPILEEYLREKYPSFEYNSSTCKEIKDLDALNAEIDRKENPYKYVVLDYNLNNDWESIGKINHPEKLEVLVNTLCIPACPRRGEHYRQISRDQRTVLNNRNLPKDQQIPIKEWVCDYGEHNCIWTIQDYPTVIKPDQIWNQYVPAGINNFKIEGRTASLFSLIDTYTFYMIKPEYQGICRLLLLKNLQAARVVSVNTPKPTPWIEE